MLVVKKEFQELKRKYPKEEASKIAWSVFFIEDRGDKNPLRNMSTEERVVEVQKTYYNIDVNRHADLIKAYGEICLTKEQKLFKDQLDLMDRITAKAKAIDTDDIDQLNKLVQIMGRIPKAWDGLKLSRDRMFEADSKIKVRGGTKESYREKRSR